MKTTVQLIDQQTQEGSSTQDYGIVALAIDFNEIMSVLQHIVGGEKRLSYNQLLREARAKFGEPQNDQ